MENRFDYLKVDGQLLRDALRRYPPIGPTKFDATILFGGKHTRFGGNKHLADVHGHPPIWYTVRSLRKLDTNRIRALVSPPYQEENIRYIESELSPYGVEPVADEKNFWSSWNKVKDASLQDHGEELRRRGIDIKLPSESSKSDPDTLASFDYFCRTAPIVEYYMGDSLYNISALQMNRAAFVEDQIHDFSTEIIPEYVPTIVGYSRRPMLHVMKTNQRSKRTIPTSSDPVTRRIGPVRVSLGFANWMHEPENKKKRAIGSSSFDSLPSRYDSDMMLAGDRYMDGIRNFHSLVKDHHDFMRSMDAPAMTPHQVAHPNSYIVLKSDSGFFDVDTRNDLKEVNETSLYELIGEPLSKKELAQVRRLASWFK